MIAYMKSYKYSSICREDQGAKAQVDAPEDVGIQQENFGNH